jgi:pimeloyl-ACP methyl ester carboxylesterase
MKQREPLPCPSCQLADGRLLAYQCFGQPRGRPLYFFHGFPGCRLQALLLHAQALAADVCLVAADRPGFGRSTPAPSRRISDWAKDVAQLADHLGHRRFGVLGASCGGPYALACALPLQARLDYVGLLAGIGPMDVPAIRRGQLPLLSAMFALARVSPVLIVPLLSLDRMLFRSRPQRAVKVLAGMLTVPDQRLLATDPQVAAEFGASLAEAYHQGIGGAMREAELIGSKWGFALEDIRVPVHAYQGVQDRHVPPAMARYMAERIADCRLQVYADEGHLSVMVNRFGDCLQDFLE